jgi:hypothetical protein
MTRYCSQTKQYMLAGEESRPRFPGLLEKRFFGLPHPYRSNLPLLMI